MSSRSLAIFALVTALLAPQAFAQDDDLFVPIGSDKEKPAPKSKPGKTAKKKPAKKPGTAKKPDPAASGDDDLFVPIAPVKGEVLVKLLGGVKGARLLVDNKDMGTLPLAAVSVEPGEHTIVVRRPGYAEFNRRITVEAGKTQEISVALEAVTGLVSVVSDVPGAKVTIDGQPRGTVPLTGIELKPGPHEIVISREGFQPDTQKVTIQAGKPYTVTGHLKPSAVASADRPEREQPPSIVPEKPREIEPTVPPLTDPELPEVSEDRPWYKRWYVWAGVGAAVAAAAAGTVVATQGGAKPLSPNEVCGGVTCDGVLNGIRFGR
jgi:hypothetical protein